MREFTYSETLGILDKATKLEKNEMGIYFVFPMVLIHCEGEVGNMQQILCIRRGHVNRSNKNKEWRAFFDLKLQAVIQT